MPYDPSPLIRDGFFQGRKGRREIEIETRFPLTSESAFRILKNLSQDGCVGGTARRFRAIGSLKTE